MIFSIQWDVMCSSLTKSLRNGNENSVYSSKILAEDSQGYSEEEDFTNDRDTFSYTFKALTLLSVYQW